jgi:hypothetical protein
MEPLRIRAPGAISPSALPVTASASSSSAAAVAAAAAAAAAATVAATPSRVRPRNRLVRSLGVGSRGQVWLMLTADGRTVAAKVVRREDADTNVEVVALQRVQPHANVLATVGRVEYTANEAFIFLELCDTDLLEVIVEGQRRAYLAAEAAAAGSATTGAEPPAAAPEALVAPAPELLGLAED